MGRKGDFLHAPSFAKGSVKKTVYFQCQKLIKNRLLIWEHVPMKNTFILATLLLSSSFAFGQTQISPTTDTFIQTDHEEIPCLVGIKVDAPDFGEGNIQFNTYYSPYLAVNPNNSRMLVAAMNQDWLAVTTLDKTTRPREQEVTIAYSTTGGNTWSTLNIPLHICLNGTLSNGQSVSALRYSPLGGTTGTVFIAGRFSNLQNEVDPNNWAGIWTMRSIDGGASWINQRIVSVQASDAYTDFTGTTDGTPDLAINPDSLNNVYAAWDRPTYASFADFPNTIPLTGNVFFSSSNNATTTWSNPTQIYDITKDIYWNGLCSGVSLIAATDGTSGTVLVSSFMRSYRKPGVQIFDKSVATTLFDRVVIRSLDGGATWQEHATIVSPFPYAQSHSPTGLAATLLNLPPSDGADKSHMVQNPHSGKLYLTWQSGSFHIDDPIVAQFHPQIVVSVSDDQGESWSPPVIVSRTPEHLRTENPQAYQAFDGNVVILGEDLVGFLYYDYRNYEIDSDIASTDAWLAVYRETSSSHSGSTHIGLDFVTELRVTGSSFNSDIATNNSVDGLVQGIGNTVGVASSGNSAFLAYAVTNEGQDSSENITEEEVFVDPNTYLATVDVNERLSVQFQQVLIASATNNCHSSDSSSDDSHRSSSRH